MLFAPDGRLVATYDKIHMFDVDLEGGESYRESATYQPGETAVAVSGLCHRRRCRDFDAAPDRGVDAKCRR